MPKILVHIILATFISLIVFPVSAHSSSTEIAQSQNIYDVFRPEPSSASYDPISYREWDDFLYNFVLYTGPSTRQYLRRPLAIVGSRKYYGHTSPYRAEGNKLLFSHFEKDTIRSLTVYKNQLLAWGENTEISSLPKDEQLTYWANLHNVVMIEALAQSYPVKEPAEFVPEGHNAILHDAKLITLHGVPLSLRDIREQIVFPHWEDPRVIYLFWTAEISGPTIPYTAFTANNIWSLSDEIADEFANSLRGFHVHREKRVISKFYLDHAKFYFPRFESDLMAHLDNYIRPHVREEFETDYPIKIDRYHKRIADMVGGYRKRFHSNKSNLDLEPYTPTEMRMYRRLHKKRQDLIKKGVIKHGGSGTVIIEDIETIDEFEVPEMQFKSTLTFKPVATETEEVEGDE